jgi:hypothetical protein
MTRQQRRSSQHVRRCGKVLAPVFLRGGGGGGDSEAIKAKELEARGQATLMVSPVTATTPPPMGDGCLNALVGPRSRLC